MTTILDRRQIRIIENMVYIIRKSVSGGISIRPLVEALESSVKALEVRDQTFVDRFYQFWGPLEIANASLGDHPLSGEMVAVANNLLDFLSSFLDGPRPFVREDVK